MPDNPKTLNRVSLEVLYKELEKSLFNLAFRYLWCREEAQDLVQEAFLKLWKIRSRVEMVTVKPLIFKICINLAASRIKRKKIATFFSLDKIDREPLGAYSADSGQSFRRKVATHSDRFRPPIPIEGGHFFGAKRRVVKGALRTSNQYSDGLFPGSFSPFLFLKRKALG
jgi:DNA-directed RNA polymerase specialized sigma24 family protein